MNYYSDEAPALQYQPGALFLDNGAFSANMGGFDLDPDRVISIQEALMPSLTIPLDYPFGPQASLRQMKDRWRDTRDNIQYWQSSTRLTNRLVPSLHAWNEDSLRENIRWLDHNADAQAIALGSLVKGDGLDPQSGGYFGDREPKENTIDMILSAIAMVKASTDFKIHLMGFGSSPLMLHLAYFLGADSTDSSGHRRKAAFGKIVLQSTGERYLGLNADVFGKGMGLIDDRVSDIAELEGCTCEICLTNRDLLWHDWKARALHNEHVMKVERENARMMLSYGKDVHSAYLDLIFSHSSLNRLWRYVKIRKTQLSLTHAVR
jgi:queuine/archaeosine tRNA-ribosyltransferase